MTGATPPRAARCRTPVRRAGAVALLAVALVALTSCTPPPLGRPAYFQYANSPQVWDNSDPAVLVDGTATYLYGSTNNRRVPVRRITSFTGSIGDSQTEWARTPRDAMPARPGWVDPGEAEIWAPSVRKLGSTYTMWFAARRSGAVDEVNDQCVGRAVSSSPWGPFSPDAAPLYCGLRPDRGSNPWGRGALDPEVFSAADGTRYMVVALSRTQQNIGVVRLDAAGRVVGGPNATPSILASQAFAWHDGVADNVITTDAFLENPSMVYDPATRSYLLTYSAGQWYTNRYVTGFGRCAAPTGPCTLDARGPFLRAGSGRTGAGGLTMFRDVNGTLRAAYASWTAGREGQSGSVGEFSRQTHWARVVLGPGTSAADQTVVLGR